MSWTRTFALRLGFILCLSAFWVVLHDQGTTAAVPAVGPDPDERFVMETDQPVGTLSFEVIEGRSGVHLPSRLYFASLVSKLAQATPIWTG